MKKKLLLISCFFLLVLKVQAEDIPFQYGEELKYDIRYKYGLVMLKAGTANYRIRESYYQNESSFQTILDFKTSSFFDKIYKIRDTMRSESNSKLEPMYHIRKINEGNTSFLEEVFIQKHSPFFSEVRVRREKYGTVRFDTILTSESVGYDILNMFTFARSLDYPNLQQGQSFKITTFVGRDKVNIIVHFEGQSVITKSETLKYKAYKLVVDITDEVFKESKSAMEVWISDDKNRIPLKLKAKLKIGAAEADLTYYNNLKYPLSSEIKIPRR
jgi:hypothetical protein